MVSSSEKDVTQLLQQGEPLIPKQPISQHFNSQN